MSERKFSLTLVIQAIDQITAPMRQMGQVFDGMSQKTGLAPVVATADDLGRGLAKTGREAVTFEKYLATGAAVAGGALFALVKKTAAVGDQIVKTADKLGVGVEELQRMRHAADLSGISIQTFEMALQRLTRRAAKAATTTGDARKEMQKWHAAGVALLQPLANLASALGRVAASALLLAGALGRAVRATLLLTLTLKPAIALISRLARALRRAAASALLLASALGLAAVGAVLLTLATGPAITRISRLSRRLRRAAGRALLLASALRQATIKMLLLAASGVKALITGLVAIAPMLATATAATWAWTAALLANPLTWIVVAIIAGIAAIAGAAYLIYQNWDDIVSFFTGLWDKIKTAFDEGFNPALWILEGINDLIETLFGINLAQIGQDWLCGLSTGMAEAWQDLTRWLEDAVAGLIDWMPDWVKQQLGLDIDTNGALTAPDAPQIKPVIGPAPQTQVGGAVKVQFENAPANMRIRDVRSTTPNFGVDVDAGYAMAGTN